MKTLGESFAVRFTQPSEDPLSCEKSGSSLGVLHERGIAKKALCSIKCVSLHRMFNYTVMSSVVSRPRVRGQGRTPANAQGTDAHSTGAGLEQAAGVRHSRSPCTRLRDQAGQMFSGAEVVWHGGLR